MVHPAGSSPPADREVWGEPRASPGASVARLGEAVRSTASTDAGAVVLVVCGAACAFALGGVVCGVLLPRARKPFRLFKATEDIPKEFFAQNAKIRGMVVKVHPCPA